MFERTFEAQALDASTNKLSPFSIALLIHLGAIIVALGISLVIVPRVALPDPDPVQPIFITTEPLEYKPEPPAPVRPPPSRRGTENPGPALVPPPEVPPADAPPLETPSELPPAPLDDDGARGYGTGAEGDSDGSGGVNDGLGTGASGPGGPGTGPDGPRELTPDMVAPVLLHKVMPDYPSVPRKARLEGRVTVEAVVGLDGTVESVEVLRTTNPLFDAAAISAVRQWRYRPATMNGVPVRVYFTVEVGFVLR